MKTDLAFKQKEEEWYSRLLICRETQLFLQKEIEKIYKKKLSAENLLVSFDSFNYEPKLEDLKTGQLDQMVNEYIAWNNHARDLYLRSEREVKTLEALSAEASSNGYLEEYR